MDTFFVNKATLTDAGWFNAINRAAYGAPTIAALRTAISPDASVAVFVRGYYAQGDGGGGLYYYDPTDTTSADNGGTIIVSAVGGRWKFLSFGQPITPRLFGAKGDGSDDTAPTQAAFNYAISTSKSININGTFTVSQITINGANGLSIYSSGGLLGNASVATEAVFVVKNSADMTIAGQLNVSANYSTNYSYAVRVYTDNGTAAQVFNWNINPIGAQVGIGFGLSSTPEAIVSEITMQGFSSYGCPIVVEAAGYETVVNFSGSKLISSLGANPTGWNTLPRAVIHSIGAAVFQNGGEHLLTDVTTGSAILMEPITDATNGNQYGTVVINGAAFESASQYVTIINPNSIGSLKAGAGLVQITNCAGTHTQNSFPMVSAAADFPGRIVFEGNNFQATQVRTQSNINCLGTLCDVYVDDQSFGLNFLQGLKALQGGVLHFTDRLVAMMSTCTGTVAGSGAKVPLAWTSYANTNDTQRFASFYASGTGIFTVPPGGLKSVRANLVERVTGVTQVLDASIYINGTATHPAMTMLGGSSASGWIRLEASLGDLAAGTTIQGAIFLTGSASTFNGASLDQMAIYARN